MITETFPFYHGGGKNMLQNAHHVKHTEFHFSRAEKRNRRLKRPQMEKDILKFKFTFSPSDCRKLAKAGFYRKNSHPLRDQMGKFKYCIIYFLSCLCSLQDIAFITNFPLLHNIASNMKASKALINPTSTSVTTPFSFIVFMTSELRRF